MMSKRMYRSSSSSSSSSSPSSFDRNDHDDERLAEDLDEMDLDSSKHRKPFRTKRSGRYQSEIYTGLIQSNRHYADGQCLTRLEQLITLYHDDQIRTMLLILRHYSLKHQWQEILFYLKSLLQSSYCRAYLRLYWQLIFRYLLEEYPSQSFDLFFLSQIFDNLFHSPTIHRSQALYSYLCLYLIHPDLRHRYIDIETRYKSLPRPFSAGRTEHAPYIVRFDPKFEQLLLIYLHFLHDYRLWLEEYSLSPTVINPFVKTVKLSLDNERDLELWTFKLTTNFHEIQFISNEYFDHYDPYLLKYLYFLSMTETNLEQISPILNNYIHQHPSYCNAYKYHYWFHSARDSLKKYVELDPSSSPYVLIYCQQISNAIEILDRLFDYLDYEKNKCDYNAWRLFAQTVFNIDPDDSTTIDCLRENWTIRKSIWRKFHFQNFSKIEGDKAKIAYVLTDQTSFRTHLASNYFFSDEEKRKADRLHQRLSNGNAS